MSLWTYPSTSTRKTAPQMMPSQQFIGSTTHTLVEYRIVHIAAIPGLHFHLQYNNSTDSGAKTLSTQHCNLGLDFLAYNLCSPVKETKEMIVDFRQNRNSHLPLTTRELLKWSPDLSSLVYISLGTLPCHNKVK